MIVPPKSPYNLIQEQIYDDPWKIFVACIFCNQTKRLTSEPIMWEFWRQWPTASDAASAPFEHVHALVKDLGLGVRRANTLIRLSRDYSTKDWQKDPKGMLYGVGDYALAAYQIFCLCQWNQIPEPKDGALKNYWKWINGIEQNPQA